MTCAGRRGTGREGARVSTHAVERSWCVVVPHHATGARLARHRLADELAEVVPPVLLADLVAVLAELVGNAVRHADPLPGGVVRVAWRLRPTPGGPTVSIRVTDGGDGAGGGRPASRGNRSSRAHTSGPRRCAAAARRGPPRHGAPG
ncbi:hypothetical protein ABT214_17920, partial [Micromonospora purpureochromogenes]|uniref:ATP-binding protein n=1 Tax=Micromonospora purpureochromogenes TaxID=47872 RepID=UPI003349CCC9